MNSDRIAFFSPFFLPDKRSTAPLGDDVFLRVPSLMQYTLESWSKNAIADFFIHTNCPEEIYRFSKSYKNIKVVSCSHADFLSRVHSVCPFFDLDFYNESHPWHLCHLKPTFAETFQELIDGYGFCGYLDFDVLLGDLSYFFTKDRLLNFDVFTFEQWFSGTILAFRNNKLLRTLWREAEKKEEILSDPNCRPTFDENPAGFPGAISNSKDLRICSQKTAHSWKIDFRWVEAIVIGKFSGPWPHQYSRVVYDGNTLFTEADKEPKAALVLDLLGQWSRRFTFQPPAHYPIVFKCPPPGRHTNSKDYFTSLPPQDDFVSPL